MPNTFGTLPPLGEEIYSMKNEQGFSLVELLIVVAIIAIVAAIAIPSLLTSRQAANEAGGIQGCRTIGSAEIAFAATNNQTFTDVPTLVTNNFLDGRFATADARPINGYNYTLPGTAAVPGLANAVVGPPTDFGFLGTPAANMGRWTYGIGVDQVVRYTGGNRPVGVNDGDPIGRGN
jgi:prepilin-type N-terminal cleavage/methylation domain-containing protein